MRIDGALLVPGLMAACWRGEHEECPGVHLIDTTKRCGCGCHVEPWPFEHS